MSMQARITASLIIAALLTPLSSAARTWNVNTSGSGDAPTIQAAIDSARAGDEIVVSPGNYTWAHQGTGTEYGMIFFDRDVTGITLRSAEGAEVTILDGQYKGRIMYIMAYNDIVIEGFTFLRGKAPDNYNSGGGLIGHLSTPTIRNCRFISNSADFGGGLWYGGVSEPLIENCFFNDNQARSGGAICLVNSHTAGSITDCIITGNRATDRGGGILVYNYKFTLERCLIYGNTAEERGGGLYCIQCEPSQVTHCTFSENSSPAGGGIYLVDDSELEVLNTIIAFSHQGAAFSIHPGNMLTVGCCDMYGNAGGDTLPAGTNDIGYNIYLDPQFCGVPGSGNFHLQSDSPCAPFNPPVTRQCLQIGAYPAQCGAVSTSRSSWGIIKNPDR
ncbi:MAG: hypothetical protein JXB45_06820 [Candidatus Krumholzibacteriota bacterium]|nr:hypothetical protein [Candidatus Krumholzibacteriota bacterium]